MSLLFCSLLSAGCMGGPEAGILNISLWRRRSPVLSLDLATAGQWMLIEKMASAKQKEQVG